MSSQDRSEYFPPLSTATSEGLLSIGGSLRPEWLLDAYSHGIFPWPVFEERELLAWWSPDPRAVIDLDEFHVPRRLARTCRGGRFRLTCDRDFAGVIRGCAAGRGRRRDTWLTPEMIEAYIVMHELGHTHSVEAWRDGRLAGGVYGIALGGLFAGESMFHTVRDASKVALVALVQHLTSRGYGLFDIQQLTRHSLQFGAKEISRREYLRRLDRALELDISFGETIECNFA